MVREKKAKQKCTNLRVALIGCGNMAKVHLGYVKKYVADEKIALCDKDEFKLHQFISNVAKRHRYTDLEKMILEFRPQVAHVLTPPTSHKVIAKKLLEAGCNVLIEKPMCMSSEEAEEIIQTAAQKGCLVCIDHTRILDPIIVKVKEIIESGAMGKIVNISADYSHDYLEKADVDSTSKWITDLPGGVFFDIIAHPLSLLEYFLPDLRVLYTSCQKNENDIVTDVWSIFDSKSASCSLHMSLRLFPLKNSIVFECTDGTLEVDFRNFLLLKRKTYALPDAVGRVVRNISVGFQIIKGTVSNAFSFIFGKLDSYEGLDRIISKYYSAIVSKGDSPVSAENGMKLMLLIEKIFPNGGFKKESSERNEERRFKEADILVTGGTGFIGKRLVDRLVKKGKNVRILTHKDLKEAKAELTFIADNKVEIIKGDISNYCDVKKAVYGVNTIYHLAAATKGDWNYHVDATIRGTKNILDAGAEAGVRRLVYASTLSVYKSVSFPRKGIVDEDFPYEDRPLKRGFYSNAKLTAEKMVREYSKTGKMAISILRPGLVYGPGGKKFHQDIGYRLGKKAVIVLGMGRKSIPLTYIENVVDAFVLAGEADQKKNSIFNVVDNDHPSQQDYIMQYKQLTDSKIFTIRIPMWSVLFLAWSVDKGVKIFLKKSSSLSYKIASVGRSVKFSTKRIERELGWQQRVHFKKGLKLTLIEDQGLRQHED